MTPENQNIVYYKGAFSAPVLSRIGTNIRKKLSSSKKVAKRVFSIFLELGQNVALYSSETNNYGDGGEGQGIGVVLLKDKGDSYELTFRNLVEKSSSNVLAGKLDQINGLEERELRKLKINQREAPREEGKDGGNIGLIHVALQSGNTVNYRLEEMNDSYNYITLNINVKKD
ncbi:MAG: putative glyoxalase superfamily protein PhnB [Arenicella sp.]